jgi:myo-inositol-1(or 4)-monophosphatase
MGEEAEDAEVGEECLGDEPTWIVDPIDGTTNFVHQFRMTVISIALAVDRKAVVGVIYCPFTDELYEAVVGDGAQCNGRPLKIDSRGLDLRTSLIISEFGATGANTVDAVQARMRQISRIVAHGVHGIRMLGSAAFNLTQVANGSAQIYFETGIHAWDVAAGVLIVREAGGVVREFVKHGEFRLNGRSVIAAANEDILSELVGVLELK